MYIGDFMKGFQPVTNIVKCENGDPFVDLHSVLSKCWNYFLKVLNLMRFIMISRQKYIQQSH